MPDPAAAYVEELRYLVVVDFYSMFIEISKLRAITSDDVIGLLKSIFARHGIFLMR